VERVCAAGHYQSGPIELVSHLRLEFDAGAVLPFPAQMLPLTRGRQQGVETLTPVPADRRARPGRRAGGGPGNADYEPADWIKLHGRKQATATDLGSANGDNWESCCSTWSPQDDSGGGVQAAAEELRPSFLRFMNARDVLVDGLHFEGSPIVDRAPAVQRERGGAKRVIETYPGVQTDGIVVDSSRFVHLTDELYRHGR